MHAKTSLRAVGGLDKRLAYLPWHRPAINQLASAGKFVVLSNGDRPCQMLSRLNDSCSRKVEEDSLPEWHAPISLKRRKVQRFSKEATLPLPNCLCPLPGPGRAASFCNASAAGEMACRRPDV